MSKSVEATHKYQSVPMNEFFDLPNTNVESYFDRVRKGQPVEYRTKFAEGKQLSEVLSDWDKQLRSIQDTWPSLYSFESDLRAKVGPMSIMKPLKERMDDIDHYYSDILRPAKAIPRSAIAAVLKEWSQARGIDIRSTHSTIENMRLDTNSGTPYFTKRRNVVQMYDDGHHWVDDTMEGFKDSPSYLLGAILGWRGQEGGPNPDDVKQRVVWMFPFGANIAELQFYQPAIENAQRFSLVPAWISNDAVDMTVTNMFSTKGATDLIVCTDFSRFDQHFNPSCQEAAHAIIRDLLNNSRNSKDWLDNVFPIKYNVPLIYDYGKIVLGAHGMASGSGGTNFDETIVHRALQYEAAQVCGARLNINSQCLGDDGVLTFPGITVEKVLDVYSSHGLDMNPDKQYASTDDLVYLRRWYHKDYLVNGVNRGVYSTFRALGRLMEQERSHDPKFWGPIAIELRQLSILENVKWHPLREEFVEFCMKRDKHRLGMDIPGFLDRIELHAAKATGVMPNLLGYNRTYMDGVNQGIGSWWVVKYLKSRAKE